MYHQILEIKMYLGLI